MPRGRKPQIAAPATDTNAEVADVKGQCDGWRNNTLDTWSDPTENRMHSSQRGGFTSQHRQDKILWYELFFRRKHGIYADVAANHFKRISNTYFLDRCAGWQGLCVEPNTIYHKGLRQHRSCHLAPTCVSDSHDMVELTLPDRQWLGGMGGINNGSLLGLIYHVNGTNITGRKHSPLWSHYPPQMWPRVRMRCSLLGELFAARNYTRIHFLNLDVEGHEAAVLRGVNFSAVTIDYILCEKGCDAVLLPLGYQKTVVPNGNGVVGSERLWTRRELRAPWRPRPPKPFARSKESKAIAAGMAFAGTVWITCVVWACCCSQRWRVKQPAHSCLSRIRRLLRAFFPL